MRIKSIAVLISSLLLLFVYTTSFAADEDTPEKKPSYVSLGEAMVLNLSNNKKLSFLQLKADVLVSSDDAQEIVQANIPAIRHQLIVLLSEQSAIDMRTPVKREEVRQLATAQVRSLIEEMTANKDIEEVLFTVFLVQ